MVVHVAVAVIQDSQGRVLLTRRKAGTHQGGLWEFPGGKVESGETLSEALSREIQEELGIEVLGHQPLIAITHHYDDRSVLLDVHRITRFRGEPKGMEGQPLSWVTLEDMGDYPLPEADVPIVTALSLPDRYLITGDDPFRPQQFIERLSTALSLGISLIQLRAPQLDETNFLELAKTAADLCGKHKARLLLNAPPEWALKTGAAGVHLNSGRLMALDERPLPCEYLVAASCHNRDELLHAQRVGVDFVLLSPVLATATHPDAQPIGWEGFSEQVAEVSVPVYALGGMTESMIQVAVESGGQGIAAIRSLWPPQDQ